MRGTVIRFLVFLLAAGWALGCSSTRTGSRWSRHFNGTVWSGALEEQIRRPDRFVPEVALLATIPVSFIYDTDIQKHAEDQDMGSAAEGASTALQVALPAIAVTISTVDWAQGDEGQNFEVVAESLVGVVAAQQVLAHAVDRERPNNEDNLSFPSGHTSWAFAATTLIVRDLHDPADTSFHAVDVLLYAPAIFQGWERIAANKHWASDVTCGALLGVFLTNWIWDAHYRVEGDERPAVFMEGSPRGVAWSPKVDLIDGHLAVGIQLSL